MPSEQTRLTEHACVAAILGRTLTIRGIANVLRYVRAAMEAGVELGLSPDLAKQLAAGSLAGTAALLKATGLHPEALVDSVTTPGGLTIRGINTMEAYGFSSAVIAGVKAAAVK